MNTFEKLCRRSGGFSLPFLIHLYDDKKNIEMFFINNSDVNVLYDGNVYLKSVFTYKPNISVYGFDGGGKLEITVLDNQTIDLVERYNDIHLDVVATMNEQGQFTEIKTFRHHYGTVSGNRKTISFDFDKDDRTEMTFPTLIWTTLNNKGNS